MKNYKTEVRDTPFFKDTLRKTRDMAGQQIELPILYYDVRCINSIFTAKTRRLRKLLPYSNFRPIEMWPGTGMLGITAFEYHDTTIGPYNEVSISIPIKFPPRFAFPGIAAISMIRANIFHVYVHHLPVTSEIALKAGIHFWNYPKFLAEITFQDHGENTEVTLKEKGELILKLFAKKLTAKCSAPLQIHTYSLREDVVMHALADGWASQLGTVMMGNVARLELGEHRIGKELVDLGIGENARSGQYIEGMITKLYEPDQLWNVDTLSPIDLHL
jgi:hypothetical protein